MTVKRFFVSKVVLNPKVKAEKAPSKEKYLPKEYDETVTKKWKNSEK
jgi:hypothetical protein